jgi:hypothetical protein
LRKKRLYSLLRNTRIRNKCIINIYINMAALDKEPITKLEKWINRIATAAIAIWQAVQYLLTHWQSQS